MRVDKAVCSDCPKRVANPAVLSGVGDGLRKFAACGANAHFDPKQTSRCLDGALSEYPRIHPVGVRQCAAH